MNTRAAGHALREECGLDPGRIPVGHPVKRARSASRSTPLPVDLDSLCGPLDAGLAGADEVYLCRRRALLGGLVGDPDFASYARSVKSDVRREAASLRDQAQKLVPSGVRIKSVKLSGSFSKGRATPESDVDVAVEYTGPVQPEDLVEKLAGKLYGKHGAYDVHPVKLGGLGAGYNGEPSSTDATRRAVKRLAAGKASIVDEKATTATRRAALPAPPPSSGSWELDREQASHRARAAEDLPPEVPVFPVGTFRRGRDGDLEELRRIPIADLTLKEDLASKRPAIVEKYAAWDRSGSRLPPVQVTENVTGKLLLADGHHRVAAAKLRGKKSVDAWVAMTWNARERSRGITEAGARCLAVAKGVEASEYACGDLVPGSRSFGAAPGGARTGLWIGLGAAVVLFALSRSKRVTDAAVEAAVGASELFGQGVAAVSAAVFAAQIPAEARPHADAILRAAGEAGVSPWLVVALGMRESGWGKYLDADGTGDGGHGRGFMQIDDRSNADWLAANDWHDPYTNISKGLKILKNKLAFFSGSPPVKNLTDGRTVQIGSKSAGKRGVRPGAYPDPRPLQGDALAQAAIAAYNTGEGNVLMSIAAGKPPDTTTAAGPSGSPDYSSDVIARAAGYAQGNVT